jgi:hypothetical protein
MRVINDAAHQSTRPPMHWACACGGEDHGAPECVTASRLSEQVEIRHGIVRIAAAALRARGVDELSSSEVVEALRREGAQRQRENLVIGCLAARGAEWLADVWGARGSWSFGRTVEFAATLRQLLVDALGTCVGGGDGTIAIDSLSAYQQVALDLHLRTTDPYPGCSAICSGALAGSCLYRHAVASTLQRSDVLSTWIDARARDTSSVDGYPLTWGTCVTTIASEVVGPRVGPQARRAVALCFAQQAVAAESPAWPPWSRAQFIDGLVALAEHDQNLREDVGEPGAADARTTATERVTL